MNSDQFDFVQISNCGNTIWVHAEDGSTVGRFSKIFGMDVHTTVSDQLLGESQCLHCTHEKSTQKDWVEFCQLIELHHAVLIEPDLMNFSAEPLAKKLPKP